MALPRKLLGIIKMSITTAIVCPHCNRPSTAEIIGRYSYLVEGPDEPGQVTLLKCGNCREPVMTFQWGDIQPGTDDVEWGALQVIYPKEERELSWDTPQSVERSFKEAERCFRAGCYTATVIMCRRSLEATCVENGAAAGNLAVKLEKMKEDGLLDGTLLTWATMLRMAGNDAAHETASSISKQDASDVLDFTHAVIEHIYTYRRRYEAFSDRRKKS